MKFAEKLEATMERRRFNNRRLSLSSGVSEAMVSRYLSGRTLPDLSTALRLARALGVTLDFLVDPDATNDPVPMTAEETLIISLAKQLGERQSLTLLETARVAGYEVAMARLLSPVWHTKTA